MKKTISLVLACLLCVALFAGCSNGSSSGGSDAAAAKVLTIAIDGEPNSLDCVMDTDDKVSEVVYGSVFEKLVAFTAEDEVIPELAESFEISDDHTVYTYKLRTDVKFHNGEPMTADDVVASMNRWIDNAENAQSLVGDARFEKVDDATVQIKLEKGTLYLNEMIAGLGQQAAIMPASVIEGLDEGGIIQEYIGTGPYKYEDWLPDQYIKLVANPDYVPYGTEGDYSGWGGYKTAYYDEVFFYFPGDPSTMVDGLRTGEYDMINVVGADQYSVFDGDDAYTMFSAETEQQMLIFNKEQGVASNAKVRQAVQAVINAEDLLYAAKGNEELYNTYSSYMFKQSANWYTEAGQEFYNQNDPETAKKLFEEAGWQDTDTFRILVDSDANDYYAEAQVIQEELRGIGINCEVLAYDSDTYRDVRNNKPGEWDAFITGFGPKVLPNMNLYLSASWAGKCADERVQSDLAAIAAESELSEAQQIWNDLQQYMYEEYVPVVLFGTTQRVGVHTSDLTGAIMKERMVWVDVHPVEA